MRTVALMLACLLTTAAFAADVPRPAPAEPEC
jgi:hypothetical protein